MRSLQAAQAVQLVPYALLQRWSAHFSRSLRSFVRKPNSLATMCAISGSTIDEGEILPSPICPNMLTTSDAFFDIAAASSRTETGTAGI